ncbi:MAG: isoprenylcysteine carboxylmethyltransferase family protein [Syntrophorhabdales bacterium]|jgi:protein-S-isoprenylcysteine O-methyltransferase Ste14
MLRTKIEGMMGRAVARIGILAFFVMAFEIMIMISPFAFFFYSVFNPIFHWLDSFTATRWLTAFFLPHMVLPPTLFLKTVRVFGSVCFVVGSITFVVCALQIYLGKIFKWGVASHGLYRVIRHPQYTALGTWGIGMSILWPRFIVLASLSVMFILYYFLAKDEEKRMLDQYGRSYRDYMDRTGMFVPKGIERYVSFFPAGALRYSVMPLCIIVVVMGTGFLLRSITLNSLLFESKRNLTLLSILPEDRALSTAVLAGILKNGGVDADMSGDKDYIGYVMPVDYIMQGMIADTGTEFHLYKQHHTVAMINEWVLHPFQHLRASPSLHMAQMFHVDPAVARRHHCPVRKKTADGDCNTCTYRRVAVVEIGHGGGHLSGSALLSVNTTRTPVSFVDVDAKTGEIADVTRVKKATAWEDVPTPAI